MKFGFVMPFGDAAEIADAAVVAEGAGWDALFAWESVWGNHAWVSLTAAAMVTESLRLGTTLTPLPRYKPWDLTWTAHSTGCLWPGHPRRRAGRGP